jgi:thymidylate synthase ThyX
VSVTRGQLTASVIADSVVRSVYGSYRITTLAVDVPRMVLAEFNTHRALSRNSASSRAIPARRIIERVNTHPLTPAKFPLGHKGMQASEWAVEGDGLYERLISQWHVSRDTAVASVNGLLALNASKQIANRILEPWLITKVLVTATDWENFIALRANPGAQYEMMVVAEMILDLLNSSNPIELQGGEWHVPFGDRVDRVRLAELLSAGQYSGLAIDEAVRRIAIARCARVSYFNFDGPDDYQADLSLFDKLRDNGHMSPFEHVAMAMSHDDFELFKHVVGGKSVHGRCGNLQGFRSYRSQIPTENRPDLRLKKV